jgi:hypothetical protein
MVSVFFHLLVFAILGLQAPRARWLSIDRSKAVSVALMRSIDPDRRPTETQTASMSRPPPAIRAAPSGTPSAESAAPAEPGAGAGPPSIAPAGPAPASGGRGSGPGRLYGEDGPGAQALLKGLLGCDLGAAGHQTQEEKEKCDRQLAVSTRGAQPFSGIPPEKREYYDAVVERYAQLRDPTPPARGGLPGAPGLLKQPRFVIPLFACGMPIGGPPQPKDKRGLTDRIKQDAFASVDIGPLKCGIPIPTGSLTPEVGIRSTPP